MNRFVSTTTKLLVFVVAGLLIVDAVFGDSFLRPDVRLVGLAVLALAEGAYAAATAGFVMGVIVGATAPDLLGLHALAMTLFGYGLGVYRTRMVRGVPLVEGLTVAACVFAHDVLVLMVANGVREIDLMLELLKAVPSALVTGALAVPMFRLAEFSGVMHRES